MKKEKLKEYLAPKMELFQFALEECFAGTSPSESVRGATQGEQDSTSIGRYKDGVNWSGHDWNE